METTSSIDLGFDASLLEGRLGVAFDWYTRKTTDMLFPVELQFTQGIATNPFRNIGTMVNKGIELGINYVGDAAAGDFRYDIGVNFSTYRNNVEVTDGNPNTRYFGFTTRLPSMTVTQAGYPISSLLRLPDRRYFPDRRRSR